MSKFAGNSEAKKNRGTTGPLYTDPDANIRMRHFVVLGHEAPLVPDFRLKDLPGSAGHLDVLCRCINSAFFVSGGIREEVRLYLVLQDKAVIRFEGEELKYLNPDERSTAARIRDALETYQKSLGEEEVPSSEGIYVSPGGVERAVEELPGEAACILLDPQGRAVGEVERPEEPVFFLRDHVDFTDAELEVLEETIDLELRLGPVGLHADHAVITAHNCLDAGRFL